MPVQRLRRPIRLKPYAPDYSAMGRKGAAIKHARERARAGAPDQALLERLRESSIGYYTRALAELADASEKARAAYVSGDEDEKRRALRSVWAANLKVDRYHDELLALWKPTR